MSKNQKENQKEISEKQPHQNFNTNASPKNAPWTQLFNLTQGAKFASSQEERKKTQQELMTALLRKS